jgi:hypothetical protein
MAYRSGCFLLCHVIKHADSSSIASKRHTAPQSHHDRSAARVCEGAVPLYARLSFRAIMSRNWPEKGHTVFFYGKKKILPTAACSSHSIARYDACLDQSTATLFARRATFLAIATGIAAIRACRVAVHRPRT